MAVILYREGNETEVSGVKCISKRFDPFQYHQAIKDGWVVDPSELYRAPTFEEADTNNSGKLSVEEIRQAAKEAGIDGWEKGRISRLKRELGYGG